MAEEKLFKVKVKGPEKGYRSIGKYFSPQETLLAVTAAQLAELRSEGVLLIADLPDDFDIAAAAPKPAPQLADLIKLCEAQSTRLAALEGQAADAADQITLLEGRIEALEAKKK